MATGSGEMDETDDLLRVVDDNLRTQITIFMEEEFSRRGVHVCRDFSLDNFAA